MQKFQGLCDRVGSRVNLFSGIFSGSSSELNCLNVSDQYLRNAGNNLKRAKSKNSSVEDEFVYDCFTEDNESNVRRAMSIEGILKNILAV